MGMGVPGELRWQCTPGCPQHLDGDPFPGVLGDGCLRPASRSFGVVSCLGGHARGGSGPALGGTVATPGPCRVPAPSPTAAISSSRSGSARAAGINQPGGTASAEPMRSGCCHGDAGRC